MKIKFLLVCILSVIVSCGGVGDDYTQDPGNTEWEEKVTEGNPDGFITVSENKRYFQYGDGTPFIPIGHNGHYAAEFFLDKEQVHRYFAQMKEHGVNVYRLILDVIPWPSIEVESKVGEFNPVVVEAMDNAIEAAEQHGIYLLVALFSSFYPILGNWNEHSYNINHDPQNGLVEDYEEMLTNEAAIVAAKERIRFFVERWGSSPNIFSWELWNEVNAAGTVEAQNRWIAETGSFLKELEMELYGAHHLRTASSNNAGWGSSEAGIYSSPELDFTSYHTYDPISRVGEGYYEGVVGFSRINPVKYFLFIKECTKLIIEKSSLRPVLGTEDIGIITDPSKVLWPFNLSFRGYTTEQLDDFFLGSAWASFMAGGSGANLRWPCNPVYGEDTREGYFDLSNGMFRAQKAMKNILSNIDWTQFSPASTEAAVDTPEREDIIPMVLAGEREMLVWLLHNDLEFSRSEVRPSVTFQHLQRASYRITWYDVRTGAVLQEDRKQGPEFIVQAPTFGTFVTAVLTMG